MSSKFLVIWLTLWKLTSSQSGLPTDFVITTHSDNPGNGVDSLTTTYYWQTDAVINLYSCVFTPNSPAGTHTCNSAHPSWTGPIVVTSTALTSHYMKLQYTDEASTEEIEIEKIEVTLDNALTYTMETFCIRYVFACFSLHDTLHTTTIILY